MDMPSRDSDKSQNPSADERAIEPAEEVAIELFEGNGLDIDAYRHESIGSDSIGIAAHVDALMPLAVAGADAAAQFGQAIVRFPQGVGWNDLLLRKAPGWEGWKQLGVLRDGKFGPQAAIKQAGLQPAAVANLALQGAALVVGQMYMVEINKQLKSIDTGIASIQKEMRMEREAKIESRFEKLLEYTSAFEENSINPEKRAAVHNSIEQIGTDVLEVWKFEVKSMRELGDRLAGSHNLPDKEMRNYVAEFQAKEQDAQVAFQLYLASLQVSMQYDGDFSEQRIKRERQKVAARAKEYSEARQHAQWHMNARIADMRTDLFGLPGEIDDNHQRGDFFADVAHNAGVFATRYNPLALHNEGIRKTNERKDHYRDSVQTDNPIDSLEHTQNHQLDRIEFIYNKADAMVIEEGAIHFIESGGDSGTAQ